MRPLKGVVVEVKKGWMKIHLRSGKIIATRKVAGMGRGTKVEVDYDFTHNRVRDVRHAGMWDVPDVDEQTDVPQIEEPIKTDDEAPADEIEEKGAFSVPEPDEIWDEEWEEEQEREELGALSSPDSEA